MSNATHKLQLALSLTSAAVLIPEIAYSQTGGNTSNMDSFGKSKLPSIPQTNVQMNVLQDIPASISQPESFEDLLELGGYETGVNLEKQIRVEDLVSKDSNIKPCNPTNIGQPEFTKVVDLVADKSRRESCIPTNIGQPEFSSSGLKKQLEVKELETKQISPNSSSPNNFPLVAELERKPNIEQPPDNSKKDHQYILQPHIVPNHKVHPFSTTLSLNDRQINHLTTGEFVSVVNFGDRRNTNFDVNGIFRLNSQIEKSISRDNILLRKQTGSYIQLQTVNQKREVSVSTKQPQTLSGIDVQLSLIASCLSDPKNLCTYTPSLFTNENFIDPVSLQPTKFLNPSQFGDVVTPQSFATIQQPGFQSGIGGQEIGVNLSFPKTGSSFGNSQSKTGLITRKETTQNTPTGFYSTVRQVFKANHQKAVVGRTVRGFGFILNDENSLLNSSLQLSNILLPDVEPSLAASDKPVNENINHNLFFALNNVRQPNNSFTIYHAGIGSAESPPVGVNQFPAASFNSIWLGISPVKRINISGNSRYEFIGSPQVTAAGGSEGGAEFNGNFISQFNDQTFANTNLENVYSQIYLTGLKRDANFLSSSSFQEITNYYPHLSLSGNITGTQNIFRYYGGLITSEKVKAYLGADFTRNTSDGWTYSVGGIGYTNPDRDYYSQIQGNISKKIEMSKDSLLVLSTAFNYAIDGDTKVNTTKISNSASSVNLSAAARFGSVSFSLSSYFGGILPNSVDSYLLTSLSLRFSDNFQLSGYYKPIDESSGGSRYGASATFKLGNNIKSPTLSISWNNSEYRFGTDPAGNKLDVNDNSFTVLLKGNL
jgi:hypothetical protein